MDYTFLSDKFYNDYPHDKYPQILIKDNRPYYSNVKIQYNDIKFVIPLHSNINHPYAYWTDKQNKCGVDYTKAIPILNDEYLDDVNKPYIRPNEHKKLQGKHYRILNGFIEYIKLYVKAKNDKSISHRNDILAFSTLQYFEDIILNMMN